MGMDTAYIKSIVRGKISTYNIYYKVLFNWKVHNIWWPLTQELEIYWRTRKYILLQINVLAQHDWWFLCWNRNNIFTGKENIFIDSVLISVWAKSPIQTISYIFKWDIALWKSHKAPDTHSEPGGTQWQHIMLYWEYFGIHLFHISMFGTQFRTWSP